MKVLKESGVSQNVKFIARELYVGVGTAVFTNEETDVSYSYTITTATDRIYTYFDKILGDLKENHNYYLTVSYGVDTELYRGKVFVTNQTDYDFNNGEYLENETTNEYLTAD